MPALDTFHDAVPAAPVGDGWMITHDPFTTASGRTDVFADLGAERRLAAEKVGVRILVEIKSFRGASEVRDLELAIGQLLLYQSLILRSEPDRLVYMAVPEAIEVGFLSEPATRTVLDDLGVRLFSFNPESEEVVRWRPPPSTDGSSAR